MGIIHTKNYLDRIDQLIRLKATGTPKELASKLKITERTIFRIINQLKELGCPIYFNKESGSYCYEQEGKLIFEFKASENEFVSKIKNGGGKIYLKNIHTDSLCQWHVLGLS